MVVRLRSLLAFLALPCAVWATVPGCARQGEGARCSRANGNLDCQDPGLGLVCTLASELRGGDDLVDRCCPPRGETVSDSRCERRVGTGEGGAPSEGGDSGAGAEGGDSSLNEGSPCDYTSECDEPLICGPGGRCQYECVLDRDCDAGMRCRDRTCVMSSGGSAP